MRQYIELVKHVLATGTRKENRTGVDTWSTFGHYLEHDMRMGFPLLTTKSVSWKNIVIEMLWFLSGQTDISILKRHGCKFWDAWADEQGKVPSAYGSFWANFPAATEPMIVPPREPSGNDYVKPVFPEEAVTPGHELCGQVFVSQNDGEFKIIRHVGADAEGRGLFDIQFLATGYVKKSVRADVVRNGQLRDRYAVSIHGVGYLGEPEERTTLGDNLHEVWRHMLDRCYDPACKEYRLYGEVGVTVCTRWHNFANFREDCRTLPNWVNKRDNPHLYAIDKDFFSSRCYSATTCVWLLHEDNRLYAHSKAIRITFPDGTVRIALSATEAEAISEIKAERVRAYTQDTNEHHGFKFERISEPYRRPLPNNQIRWVLDELRRNPMSRRMVVSAWAPGNAQTSKLPPCHCLFMFNVQNELRPTGAMEVWEAKRLCLHLTQRSCDVALGVPYNIASYALLLALFARFSGIEPGVFGYTLVDAHIYCAKPDWSMSEFDHVPGLREQIAREPRKLPRLIIDESIRDLTDVEGLMHPSHSTEDVMRHFVLEGYDPHPAIPFKVAV